MPLTLDNKMLHPPIRAQRLGVNMLRFCSRDLRLNVKPLGLHRTEA